MPDTSRGVADDAGIAAELLSQGHRHRVLKVGPRRLDDLGELRGFVRERVRKVLELDDERTREFERRETDRGGDHVVRRLTHIHVVFRRDELVGAARITGDLVRAIRDHFIDVHVMRDAGAGLERIDDELIEMLSGEDLIARAHDHVAPLSREPPGLSIRERRDNC